MAQQHDTSWHQAYIEHYRKSGQHSLASAACQITYNTVRLHRKRFPEFDEACEEANRQFRDRGRLTTAVKVETEQKRAVDERMALPVSLTDALTNAIRAPESIPEQQAHIRKMIDKAKNDIAREAYEYLHDYVEKHTLRAAALATERREYLRQIETKSDAEFEMEKCAAGTKGTLHWFNIYAWGIDPRARGILKVVPFGLFPVQQRFIEWIEDSTFNLRTSGLCEKSRDQGATEAFVRWCIKQWLFMPHFSALMISKGEDDVDDKKKKGTLFGRLRFQMRLLPNWMIPKGFELDRDMPFMSLSNPTNSAEITGKAPTPNVGRSDRTTVVLADEFAAWPGGGYEQDTALSETSPSIFKVSSVQGMGNRFYEEASAVDCNLFVMDWKEHPFKDRRWYNSLPFGYIQKKMRADEIAQEIDRNYQASQPGLVWPHFSEAHTVIMMSEFRAYYEQRGVRVPGVREDDWEQQRIPLDWHTARFNDRGATPGHRNAWLWAGGPRQHQPLSDSVFCYREWLAPLGSTFTEIAETVHEFEETDGEAGRIIISQNSHEAESERNNYELEHDLILEPWKTDYEAGIAQVSEFMTVIDKDKPNPFRPQIMGRTRLIILVADGQGALGIRENGEKIVTKATDSLGMENLRRQVTKYHYPPEERGKPVGKMRPRKEDDDLVDDLRALALEWDNIHAPQTGDEKIKERLKRANPRMVREDIMQIEDEAERRMALNSFDVNYQKAQRDQQPQRGGNVWANLAKQNRHQGSIWGQQRRSLRQGRQ